MGVNGGNSDIEFDGFQNYLLEKGNREKTVEDYVRHMKNFQKWMQIRRQWSGTLDPI
jgi:sarcosine oxidase delta subunit